MEPERKRRNVEKLYKPPPEQDYTSNYIRLIIVILISVVFIGGEVFAGILADSIAIISDAIHLVSDLIAFIFSFLFLYLSKKPPTSRMTFGYHRMELLGALANIFIIWFLIIFVMYEATLRIIDKSFVQKPFVMLIAAGAGLIVNIIMYKILHGGATHSHGLLADACHDHGHEHGHEHGHGHGHAHSHSHSRSSEQNSEHHHHHDNLNESSHPRNRNAAENQEYQQQICKDDECNSKAPGVHYHGSTNMRQPSQVETTRVPLLGAQNQVKPDEVSDQLPKRANGYCEDDHQHLATCYLKPQRKVAICHICTGVHDPERHNSGRKGHEGHKQSPERHSSKGQLKKGQHEHGHGHQHHHGHEHHHDHSQGDSERNTSIGMQAAILHALSDMIMSVGLVISSIVIFFLGTPQDDHMKDVTEWNAWHLFDPISTYLFSVVSLISTIPVIKNSYYLMMESTPTYIDIEKLQEQFEKVEGVIDVHDIHVWDLKPGKTMVIAHVLAKRDTERQVLIELSDIARLKKIYHSTFQVQEQEKKEGSNYILCHHDIH